MRACNSRNALGHFTRAILCEILQVKCRSTRARPTLCASLRSRVALGHFTRAILCEILQVKGCRTRARPTLCASLHSRVALGHFTRAILCEILQVKCRRTRARPTLCASLRNRNAVGHVRKFSQNAADRLEHPDQAPVFTFNYRKNPSVWTLCSGYTRNIATYRVLLIIYQVTLHKVSTIITQNHIPFQWCLSPQDWSTVTAVFLQVPPADASCHSLQPNAIAGLHPLANCRYLRASAFTHFNKEYYERVGGATCWGDGRGVAWTTAPSWQARACSWMNVFGCTDLVLWKMCVSL